MNKLKKIWKIFKLIWNSKKQSELEELIPLIEQSQKCVVLFSNETENVNENNTGMWIPDETMDVGFVGICRNVMKNNIVRMIGQQRYEENIEQFDYDTAMAYKEIDYQMARADALESEFMYYREINNPNGMKGPQLLHLWERVCELKKRLYLTS